MGKYLDIGREVIQERRGEGLHDPTRGTTHPSSDATSNVGDTDSKIPYELDESDELGLPSTRASTWLSPEPLYEVNEFHERSPETDDTGTDAAATPAKLLPPVASSTSSDVSPEVVAPEFFEDLRRTREALECAGQERSAKQRGAGRARRPTNPTDYSMPFGAWMLTKWRDPGPVGDLICAFRQEPQDSSPEHWEERLRVVQAHKRHTAALKQAVRQWKQECKKGPHPGRGGREEKTASVPNPFLKGSAS